MIISYVQVNFGEICQLNNVGCKKSVSIGREQRLANGPANWKSFIKHTSSAKLID